MSCQPTVNTTRPLSDVDGETASTSTTAHERRPPNIRDIVADKLRVQHEASQPLSSASHLDASPAKCNGISSEFNTTTMMTPTTDMRPPLDQEVPAVDTSGPQHCDKNKQHENAISILMAQDQQSACPARRMTSTTAEKPSSSYSNTTTTELTGPDEMNQTDAISETPSGHTEFRVPMAKSLKIEEENSSPPTNRRALQRKASVFSHDGFLGIHQLDQSALKQHSSLQDLTKGSQQEMQANLIAINNNGSSKIEDLSTKLASPTVAPAPPSSSPQRPTRSDTLGSTGSSRASSCDEPTIVSTPSSKNGSQQMVVEDAGQLNRNSSSSTDSSLDSINNGSSLEDSKPDADHPMLLLETMETKNDDDVFDSKSKPNSVPVFQSIKTQLKRNSVPDAKFITQHIEKLISQNEAIIENWDQVSIRSYNSQANGTQSSACTPSPATTSTNATTQQLASKRPSKRWSTTSLQSTCGPTESFKAADHLVEARLRRRSQHAAKRPSIRPNLPHGASALLSPNFVNHSPIMAPNSQFFAAHKDDHHYQHPAQFLFGSLSATSTANTTTSLSSSVPSSPRLCSSSSTFFEIQKFLHGRLNSGTGDTAGNTGESPSCTQMSNPTQFSQNIERAIKSLSLKQNEEERQRALIQEQLQFAASQHQQNLLIQATQQPDDLVMASMLSHYNIGQPQQQQQIFKEQHVSPISSESEIAAAILSHYQQQQALEQLKMTRLAEYQQQQLLTAAALHRQQQIQQQHQQAHVTGELVGREGLALERQPRDSQVLNEFLARMMLGRDVQPSKAPTDTQIHSQPHPIVMHNNQQQQASEMFTQPLDSATPAHRCNDCDIPFWTRDLLNYHLMTSCSARTGPQPNRPIAFNFGQPNGFDQASNLNSTTPSLLMPHSAAQLASDTALSLTSKSASPPKWPSSQNARSQDHALTQLPVATVAGSLDSVTIEEPQKRLSYAGHVLVAPKSPHKSRESAELAWKQRLTELCILKQQLIETNHITALNPQTASSSSNSNETQESNLPIKKRKISEPNMRY